MRFSRGTVRLIMDDFSIPRRSRTEAQKLVQPKVHESWIINFTEAQKEQVKRLYWVEGLNTSQIGKLFNKGGGRIRRMMVRAGIPTRNPTQANYIRPTGPERKILDLVTRYNLPYKYTGNGTFWINGVNPDFININGEKLALDIFGDYWHSPELTKGRANRTEEGRKEILQEFGWRLKVLWESEINTLPEEVLLSRIKETAK